MRWTGTARSNLSYADVGKQSFVSIPGRVRMLRDPDKARERWTQRLKAWFPSGLDDPDLGLLEVTVEQAEYWDVRRAACSGSWD